jgi:VIT1/CCC1 family predicted Fe2+/Mn2+ transporter
VHINEAVNVPGPYRRDLDRLTVRIGKHMMKNHHIFPPWDFNYLYSFYGILAGSLLGLLLVFLFPGETWEFIAAGFVAGLVAGQLSGSKKDREVRNSNRLM